MINVEQGTLRALKHDPAAGVTLCMNQLGNVSHQWFKSSCLITCRGLDFFNVH